MESQEVSARAADNIRTRLGQLGMTRTALAEAIGTKLPHVSRLLRDGREPSLDTLARVADALAVLPGELLGDLPIRVYGSVPCGPPAPVPDDDREPVGMFRLADLIGSTDDVFALRARGKSMAGAAILDGDTMFFRRASEAPPRSTVLAALDGDYTVKRYISVGGARYLEACDGTPTPARVLAEDATIFGVLVAVARSVK